MTISFRRNGSILVDGIRVGWIDQREDGRWLVRFTHASGLRMGVLDHFPRLKDAKAAAAEALRARGAAAASLICHNRKFCRGFNRPPAARGPPAINRSAAGPAPFLAID
jgi:hypothetical protein